MKAHASGTTSDKFVLIIHAQQANNQYGAWHVSINNIELADNSTHLYLKWNAMIWFHFHQVLELI